MFTDFELEQDISGECVDTVTIYDSMDADDSKLIGVYCGSQLPPVVTGTGQHLHVVFKSDGAVNYRGFNATFEFGEGKKDKKNKNDTIIYQIQMSSPLCNVIIKESEVLRSRGQNWGKRNDPLDNNAANYG